MGGLQRENVSFSREMGDSQRENVIYACVCDFRKENPCFLLKWGICVEKTHDFLVKWRISEEKTCDFRLNGEFEKRKFVIFA